MPRRSSLCHPAVHDPHPAVGARIRGRLLAEHGVSREFPGQDGCDRVLDRKVRLRHHVAATLDSCQGRFSVAGPDDAVRHVRALVGYRHGIGS